MFGGCSAAPPIASAVSVHPLAKIVPVALIASPGVAVLGFNASSSTAAAAATTATATALSEWAWYVSLPVYFFWSAVVVAVVAAVVVVAVVGSAIVVTVVAADIVVAVVRASVVLAIVSSSVVLAIVPTSTRLLWTASTCTSEKTVSATGTDAMRCDTVIVDWLTAVVRGGRAQPHKEKADQVEFHSLQSG